MIGKLWFASSTELIHIPVISFLNFVLVIQE